MAQSKCGNCGGTTWELMEVQPEGAVYQHYFIQCSECGVPVGVVDFLNLGVKLGELEKRVQHAGELATEANDRMKDIERALAK